jgi:plasmid stabilization system protein ParE
MKITSKEQLTARLPWLGSNAWESFGDGAQITTSNGDEFIITKAPEPVVMYTGHELIAKLSETFPEHSESIRPLANVFIDAITLILARRTEMLRAMGSEELAREVEFYLDDTARASAAKQNHERGCHLIALITEHIEANRPELTNSQIEMWEEEAQTLISQARYMGTVSEYIAHRAAEYRSPAVAELRAENDDLKHRMAVVLHAGPATAIAAPGREIGARSCGAACRERAVEK